MAKGFDRKGPTRRKTQRAVSAAEMEGAGSWTFVETHAAIDIASQQIGPLAGPMTPPRRDP